MTSPTGWLSIRGTICADTRHLTTLQHGACLLLILEYWMKGKLPDSDKDKATICGVADMRTWRRLKPVLAALFDGPDWRHARIDAELQKANDLKTKRAVSGSKGGQISRGRNNVERFTAVNKKPSNW